MKIPSCTIKLMDLLEKISARGHVPAEIIAQYKSDWHASAQFHASSKERISAGNFASTGGVKGPTGLPVKQPGVYFYWHEKYGYVYIGRTNDLYARTSKAKTVWKALVETGKMPSQTIYPAIPKMYELDPDPKAWKMFYVETYSENIAKDYEKKLIHEEKPLFNNECMAGK